MSSNTNFSRGDIIKVKSVWSNISPIPIWHYGVVVGDDKVVHFNLTDEFDIRIIKTNLHKFIGAGTSIKLCMMSELNREFSKEATASRAESCVGSDFGGYNLITNNCEHFANWCANGSTYSNQILSDEGEGHSIGKKIFEKYVGDPILSFFDKADKFIDNQEDKMDDFFTKLFGLK